IGLPAAARGLLPITDDLRVYQLAGEPSDAVYIDVGTSTSQEFYFNAASSFWLPAANFYDAAASIVIDGNFVVGEQVPNDPEAVVLTNDLVRVEWADSGFEFSVYDGTAWRTKEFGVGHNGESKIDS